MPLSRLLRYLHVGKLHTERNKVGSVLDVMVLWCLVCPLIDKPIRAKRRNILSKKCIDKLVFTGRPSKTRYEQGATKCVEVAA